MPAAATKEPSWIARCPPEYEAIIRRSDKRTVMERVLDDYLKRRGDPDLQTLDLTRENLLDLLCFQELNRRIIARHRGTPITGSVLLPEEVVVVNFRNCTMNWIPVDELRFLFRNLFTLAFKGVGGKIDFGDLLALPSLTSLILTDLPITEFPHVLAQHRNLTDLSIFRTKIQKVDFTDQDPFTELTSIGFTSRAGDRPVEIKGLVKGLPRLEMVVTEGAEGARMWRELVAAYPPPRQIEVRDVQIKDDQIKDDL